MYLLGQQALEYIRKRADMVLVNKILNDIDRVNKNKMFKMSQYTMQAANKNLQKAIYALRKQGKQLMKRGSRQCQLGRINLNAEGNQTAKVIINQRNNGPVNAHLISEPIISTKPDYK